MAQIHVLLTVPQPLRSRILRDETLSHLRILAEVTLNDTGHNWSSSELAEQVAGHDAILASWGLPQLTPEVLARADRLQLVAYGAGSVKGFVTDEVYGRSISVCHAAARIAASVADLTLCLAMMGLRRAHDFDRWMKTGAAWPKERDPDTFEIADKRVGLLGMGYVGQRTARLFQAVGAEVWCYDPYLPAARAAGLGVRPAVLDELLGACQIVSVHLPVTPETRHLLGARELALIRDGAVFINTARAWVVDQAALLRELASGRFWAALDVFEPEPLLADSPLRQLDNVLLTPHIAGQTRDSYFGLMDTMVDEIERFFRGQPLRWPVTREALANMA